jgi:hypothetical protein
MPEWHKEGMPHMCSYMNRDIWMYMRRQGSVQTNTKYER